MNLRFAALITASLCLWSPPASAVNFNSNGGFLFDVMETSGGELSNGTSDAYDGCYRLDVNGTTYRPGGGSEIEERAVRMPPMAIGPLQVRRTVTVPNEPGRDYAQYIDEIENTSDSNVTVTVRYHGNLGSDNGTHLWATSSGDLTLTADDQWFGTDDTDGSGDPSLAHLFWSDSGGVSPDQMTLSGDSFDVRFSVDLGPMQRVAFVIFAFQGPDQETVRQQVEALAANAAAAMADLPPGHPLQAANWSPFFGSASLATVYQVPGLGEYERQHVYNGELLLAVTEVRARMERAIDVAEQLDGHLEQQTNTALVLRVPVDRFDEAMEQLEGLGDVLSRQVTIQRGTARVRDLETRLRTAREVRDRLVTLLERTQTAAEALVIQREMERLDILIQTMESELRELQERIHFSYISLQFQPLHQVPPIPHDLFRLPFSWLDELGLENLLQVR